MLRGFIAQYASDGPRVGLRKWGQVFASLLGGLAFGKNLGIPGLNENFKIKLVCMITLGDYGDKGFIYIS